MSALRTCSTKSLVRLCATVTVQLVALTAGGRLRVSEQTGKTVDAVVDNYSIAQRWYTLKAQVLGLDVPRDGMRPGRADRGVWVLRDERR